MFNSVQEVDAPQLANWMSDESEQIRIIDVRGLPEIAQGTVPGSEALPLATLPTRLAEMDRSEKFIMVCRSGARSAQACMFMKQQGFDNVFNLRGGMMGWASGNLPVTQAAMA